MVIAARLRARAQVQVQVQVQVPVSVVRAAQRGRAETQGPRVQGMAPRLMGMALRLNRWTYPRSSKARALVSAFASPGGHTHSRWSCSDRSACVGASSSEEAGTLTCFRCHWCGVRYSEEAYELYYRYNVEVHKAKPKNNTRDGYRRHLVTSPVLPEKPDRSWDRSALLLPHGTLGADKLLQALAAAESTLDESMPAELSPVEEDVDADSLDGSGSGMHAASPARAWYSLPAAHKRDMLQSSCAALGYPVPAEFCEAALRVQRRAVS